MTFNEKTCAVHLLWKNTPFIVAPTIPQNETTKRSIPEKMIAFRSHFKKDIHYVSASFKAAWQDHSEKGGEFVVEGNVRETGTFLFNIDHVLKTIFYAIHIEPYPQKAIVNACIFVFQNEPEANFPILTDFCDIKNLEVSTMMVRQGPLYMKEPLCSVFDLFNLTQFRKHCAVQTRVIHSGMTNNVVDENYENKSPYPITILDATWFTTTINISGCVVGEKTGGFYKMQPCGPGGIERKKIHVDPFPKKPYVREAKVLKHRKAQQG